MHFFPIGLDYNSCVVHAIVDYEINIIYLENASLG